MKTLYALFAFTLILTSPLFAQLPAGVDRLCGTDHTHRESISEENLPEFASASCGADMSTCYTGACPIPAAPCGNYRVPVLFTIIRSSAGVTSLGATSDEVLAAVATSMGRLNLVYGAANVEFFQCDLPRNYDGTDATFNSDTYYSFDANTEDAWAGTQDATNVINIYLTGTVTSGAGTLCGYAKFPSLFGSGNSGDGSLRSVNANSCIVGENTTLEHELGHFFGLEHTHNGASADMPNEAANNSECCNYTLLNGASYNYSGAASDIGDGVCDTNPDPNASGEVSNQCVYTGPYVPAGGFPVPVQNIMSYSPDFVCHEMSFTPCQLLKIQTVLLGCRDYLCCPNAASDVSEKEITICEGDNAPTFCAISPCYNWYTSATGGAPVGTGQLFKPSMTTAELTTPGTYTYYLEHQSEFYNQPVAPYDQAPTGAPANCRKAVTVVVISDAACQYKTGDGVDNCTSICCAESCTFDTDGDLALSGLPSCYASSDFQIGWAITSGAGTTVCSQAELDALPAANILPGSPTGTPSETFTVPCSGGMPSNGFAIGTYNATPFFSLIPSAATTQTFTAPAFSKTLINTISASASVDLSCLPEGSTINEVCLTMAHNYVGIVSAKLAPQDGCGEVQLIDRLGYPATRPFGSTRTFNGQYCFTMAAASSLPETGAGAIAAGSYLPHDPNFAAVTPCEINGVWGVTIESGVAGVSGTFTGLSITVDVPAITYPTVVEELGGGFGDPIEFDICPALPIELIDFNAELLGEIVELKWQTAFELNNESFSIQRSIDGVNFEPLVNVPGAGNSTIRKNYQSYDESPLQGTNYYRLVQTDFDGTKTVHDKIVAIDYFTAPSFEIHPNLVIGSDLTIEFIAPKQDRVKLETLSLNGQLISVRTKLAQKGANTFVQNTEQLKPGVYLLKVTAENFVGSKRFVVPK